MLINCFFFISRVHKVVVLSVFPAIVIVYISLTIIVICQCNELKPSCRVKKNVDEKNRWVGSAVLWCRDKIRIIALKNRALYQYGVGGGGVCR